MKKYYFLSGLPRSGNTLLSSILNQNTNITVTGNSSLVGYLYGFATCDDVTKEINNNFLNKQSIDNVAKNIIPNYYFNYKSNYIIDRGPWAKKVNFDLLKKYAPNEIKILILVRDVLEVLASFIKWSNENPNNFIDKKFKDINDQCDYLMDPNGMIASGLLSIHNMMQNENKKYAHFIDYNNLVINPEKEINMIYDFLKIQKFNHRFENLNQLSIEGIEYNDSILGENLHKIKKNKIEKTKYDINDYLPKSIIDKYKSYNFWIL